ncbi:hypothetical protein [Tianweitania sediminis]|jgi:hypothetical protein|uniref:Uncharacterized protein n=1 Tax=Tianweitania sediminis TaxID=1502156 RepID=A0A8J7UI55_9HYPH|nr:hypothetical protein [Tianweitania sediminis]MBP0437430.1 hypothetical protein [Tianweitania sediminis]
MTANTNKPQQPSGTAVDDEDPNHSPVRGRTMPTGPAQPFDVEHVESDRAKSQGPKPGEGAG